MRPNTGSGHDALGSSIAVSSGTPAFVLAGAGATQFSRTKFGRGCSYISVHWDGFLCSGGRPCR